MHDPVPLLGKWLKYSNGMDAPFQKRHLGAKVEMSLNHVPKGAPEMKITTIGADLAKSVIQIHGVDSHCNTVLRKQLKRSQVMEFFTKLEPYPTARSGVPAPRCPLPRCPL